MNYVINQAEKQTDENIVLGLWKGSLQYADAEKYERIYKSNAYGPSWGWLTSLQDTAEHIGFAGLCQRQFFIEGNKVSAGVAIDFTIDKEYRGFGPALKLQRAVIADLKCKGIEFIYGFPNKQAESVFKRVKYKVIGKMARLVKVIRSDYKLKDIMKSEVLCKMVSPIVDQIIIKTFKERMYRRSPKVTIEVTDFFDERFDAIWDKAKSQFNIIGDRSAGYLNWRYGSILKNNAKIFCLLDNSKDSILGYIVFSIENNICHVIDLLFLDMITSFDLLIAEFIAYMRKERVYAIYLPYLGSTAVVDRLNAWGFVKREEERSIMLFAENRSYQVEYLLNKENWHLLEGDRKSTRLNSSHTDISRMPSSA